MLISKNNPVNKVMQTVRKLSKFGDYENDNCSIKVDKFNFDIDDVSGNTSLCSDLMKRLGIKLNSDELYEEFQRICDESVGKDDDKKGER